MPSPFHKGAPSIFRIAAREKVRMLALYARSLAGAAGWAGAARLFAEALADWLRLRRRLVPAGSSRPLRDIADAVLWNVALHARLAARMGTARADSLVRSLVLESGLALMREVFPRPDPRDPLGSFGGFVEAAMAEAAAAGIYAIEGLRRDEREVRFDTVFCIYQKLCADAGVPGLATTFCEVDGPFFEGYDPSIRFERATSLAAGGERCPFRFRLRAP